MRTPIVLLSSLRRLLMALVMIVPATLSAAPPDAVISAPRAAPSTMTRSVTPAAPPSPTTAAPPNPATAPSPPSPPSPSPARPTEPAGPSLLELQRAALSVARLDPARLASLENRLRASALLPQVRVRVGRGTGQLLTTTEYDGTARLSVGDRDAWQFDVSAAWSLDRLLFHPDELRLSREAERLAAHRERLLREVAELYAERRRLRSAAQRARPPATDGDELSLRLVAVESTLDELTGGALLHGR